MFVAGPHSHVLNRTVEFSNVYDMCTISIRYVYDMYMYAICMDLQDHARLVAGFECFVTVRFLHSDSPWLTAELGISCWLLKGPKGAVYEATGSGLKKGPVERWTMTPWPRLPDPQGPARRDGLTLDEVGGLGTSPFCAELEMS